MRTDNGDEQAIGKREKRQSPRANTPTMSSSPLMEIQEMEGWFWRFSISHRGCDPCSCTATNSAAA
jgi:hypothetical protein